MTFINFVKAFENVNKGKLFSILNKRGFAKKIINTIRNVCSH